MGGSGRHPRRPGHGGRRRCLHGPQGGQQRLQLLLGGNQRWATIAGRDRVGQLLELHCEAPRSGNRPRAGCAVGLPGA
eukprot:6239909-Alexandrium_andersonii.AAC.1